MHIIGGESDTTICFSTLKPIFEFTGNFSEGLALVQKKENGKFGYIDKSGKMVIKPVFSSAEDFSEGLAVVWKKNN